jgi:hypothetical protein
LHDLEVRNAIYQRAFHQRRTASSEERKTISREKLSAFSKLELLLQRRAFLAAETEWDAVMVSDLS